jgi:hypothetical protein
VTTAKIEPVRCACGWRGSLTMRARCPGCGAEHTHRVTKERRALLRAIGAREPGAPAIHIEPQMRIWLVEHRLLVATEPPRATRHAPGRHRPPPPRGYRLTERGEMAIAETAAHERRAVQGATTEGATVP